MTDLRLERDFPVDAARLFHWISAPEKLLQWWGPEGVGMKEHNLDLSRPGPWSSTLVNSKGDLHKMSGEVIAVDGNFDLRHFSRSAIL